MKYGVRKPSPGRSFKARTTGRVKRAAKSAINPTYGKKGVGLINNPRKAVYNKVYNKTTASAGDIFSSSSGGPGCNSTPGSSSQGEPTKVSSRVSVAGVIIVLISVVLFIRTFMVYDILEQLVYLIGFIVCMMVGAMLILIKAMMGK